MVELSKTASLLSCTTSPVLLEIRNIIVEDHFREHEDATCGLSHSPMPFPQKHPIILPRSSITTLIIEHEHRVYLHSETQAPSCTQLDNATGLLTVEAKFARQRYASVAAEQTHLRWIT